MIEIECGNELTDKPVRKSDKKSDNWLSDLSRPVSIERQKPWLKLENVRDRSSHQFLIKKNIEFGLISVKLKFSKILNFPHRHIKHACQGWGTSILNDRVFDRELTTFLTTRDHE